MAVIRVKHVHRVTAKGRVYYYHRLSGTRITAPYGTAEFIAEVQRLNELHEPREGRGPIPGTLGYLIAQYKASPEWREQLSAATRKSYDRVFSYLEPLGAMPLNRLDSPFVLQMRDKCFTTHKRWMANYVVTVLSAVWAWGKPRGHCKGPNPCENVQRIRRPKNAPEANRRWGEDELEVVLSRLEAPLALAVALGAFVGLRESDAIGWKWAALRGDMIVGRQAKTGGEIEVPIHPRLRELLDAAPRRAETIVTGLRGRPLTVEGFRALFFRRLRALEAEGLVRPGLTFHGLRHSLASALAEAGCTPHQIQSITGHETLAMVEGYVRKANRRRLAKDAMDRLVAEGRL